MKKTIKRVITVVLVSAIAAAGFYWWHTGEMASLSRRLQDEQARRELINQRIQEIQESLDSSEAEKESLLERMDAMLMEEAVVFDADAILEEIQEIGELATMEYRFTNVGTLDAVDTFRHVGWTVPFSRKTAVVTMDGVTKVGIDVSEVSITVDEDSKTIFVQIPEARILSTELFEDSLVAYIEEESLFSNITLEDSSSLRDEIKTKAEQNALESGLLTQAHDQAGVIIRCLIEAVPSIKEAYTIVIR